MEMRVLLRTGRFLYGINGTLQIDVCMRDMSDTRPVAMHECST